MHKVVDNTFLSAARGDIHCMDLLTITDSTYQIVVTPEVLDENFVKHGSLTYAPYEGHMQFEEYKRLYDLLKRRNFWIGKGELSSIVCSIYLTHAGIDNYIVTDDKDARELIQTIHTNPEVSEILGFIPPELKLAGTIGLICRMRDKGKISKAECALIKRDLKNSTFRASDALFNKLG